MLLLYLSDGLGVVPGLQFPGTEAHEAEGASDVCPREDVEYDLPLFGGVLDRGIDGIT